MPTHGYLHGYHSPDGFVILNPAQVVAVQVIYRTAAAKTYDVVVTTTKGYQTLYTFEGVNALPLAEARAREVALDLWDQS